MLAIEIYKTTHIQNHSPNYMSKIQVNCNLHSVYNYYLHQADLNFQSVQDEIAATWECANVREWVCVCMFSFLLVPFFSLRNLIRLRQHHFPFWPTSPFYSALKMFKSNSFPFLQSSHKIYSRYIWNTSRRVLQDTLTIRSSVWETTRKLSTFFTHLEEWTCEIWH